MGGFNSGNHGGKSCTSDKLALDVRKLQRDKELTPGRSIKWTWSRGGKPIGNIDIQVHTDTVTLVYQARQSGGEMKDMDYPVRLEWTTCNFGGRRAWWLCPAAGCGRRSAVLYGGAVFACRQCHQLAYKSQRETPADRNFRRADKLRDKLGWQAGILNGAGVKPTGMHWTTFKRLEDRHNTYVETALVGMRAILDKSMVKMVTLNQDLDRMK